MFGKKVKLRLVFLSGTPIRNKSYEMITILNLLNGYERALKYEILPNYLK